MSFTDALQVAEVWISELAWRMLGAVIVLTLGLLAAALTRKLLHWFLRRRPVQGAWMVPSLASLAVATLAIVLTLAVLGVASSVIGVVVTVGLALGAIGDVFYGLRIFGRERVRIGDFLELKEEGVAGLVMQTTATSTTLLTQDHTQVVVPNRMLFERLVVNHSASQSKVYRFQIVVESAREPGSIEEDLRKIIEATSAVEPGYDRRAYLTKVEKGSVTYSAELRTSFNDARQVTSDFLKAVKQHFEKTGIALVSIAAASKA